MVILFRFLCEKYPLKVNHEKYIAEFDEVLEVEISLMNVVFLQPLDSLREVVDKGVDQFSIFERPKG